MYVADRDNLNICGSTGAQWDMLYGSRPQGRIFPVAYSTAAIKVGYAGIDMGNDAVVGGCHLDVRYW